jgi:hypothetical protein
MACPKVDMVKGVTAPGIISLFKFFFKEEKKEEKKEINKINDVTKAT